MHNRLHYQQVLLASANKQLLVALVPVVRYAKIFCTDDELKCLNCSACNCFLHIALLNLQDKSQVRSFKAHLLVGCTNYCTSQVYTTIAKCVAFQPVVMPTNVNGATKVQDSLKALLLDLQLSLNCIENKIHSLVAGLFGKTLNSTILDMESSSNGSNKVKTYAASVKSNVTNANNPFHY